MKQGLLVTAVIAILLSFASASPVEAQNKLEPGPEPYAGLPLCLPDAYLNDPLDCLPLGPSVMLTDLAEKGILYPFLALPAATPEPELTRVPVNYAKINVEYPEQAPVFSSLDEAVDGSNPKRYMSPGRFLYVTYTNRVDVNNGYYVQLSSGEWMRASPIGGYSTYQGLVFRHTPHNDFGWIFEETRPRRAPAYDAPELERSLPRATVVQVYDVVEVNNTEWFMIGLNEWVERRYIRRVVVDTTPPAGVDNNRWIEINLHEQTLSVYENGELVFATLTTTGLDPFFTQPGLFKIYEMKERETMRGSFEVDRSDYYYLEDVPWTMYYDQARAMHGAYWHALFGSPQSHGCVNLSIGDSRWLFDWAKVGDWVYVWDPSGKTPTDPKLYTEGGA